MELNTTTTRSTPQPTRFLYLGLLAAIACQLIPMGNVWAAEELREVAVADPYLELHTGPGRGYPIFHVVDRGESVSIIKQRTDWYLVRDEQGDEGWVDREQMELTLRPDGSAVEIESATIRDFTNAKWEMGLMTGDFGGANIISVYGGYSLNPHVSVEVWGSQILGNFSNGWMGSVNVIHEAFP